MSSSGSSSILPGESSSTRPANLHKAERCWDVLVTSESACCSRGESQTVERVLARSRGMRGGLRSPLALSLSHTASIHLDYDHAFNVQQLISQSHNTDIMQYLTYPNRACIQVSTDFSNTTTPCSPTVSSFYNAYRSRLDYTGLPTHEVLKIRKIPCWIGKV